MDSTNFRKSTATKFFLHIQINITPELEIFLEDLGANIFEDLKLLEEKDWKNCSAIFKMNFIQQKRLIYKFIKWHQWCSLRPPLDSNRDHLFCRLLKIVVTLKLSNSRRVVGQRRSCKFLGH